MSVATCGRTMVWTHNDTSEDCGTWQVLTCERGDGERMLHKVMTTAELGRS